MYQTIKWSLLAGKLFLIHTDRASKGLNVSRHKPKGHFCYPVTFTVLLGLRKEGGHLQLI